MVHRSGVPEAEGAREGAFVRQAVLITFYSIIFATACGGAANRQGGSRDGRGGVRGEVTDDSDAILLEYQNTCSQGDMGGCHNLGVLFDHGRGVAQNYERAATFYRRACDDGYKEACRELGR